MSEKKLSLKRELFCQAYVESGNATQSAIKAMYSDDSAHTTGYRLLKNAEVQQRLEQLMMDKIKAAGVTKDKVLSELYHMAFADRTEIYGEDEKPKPISQWPVGVRKAFSGFDAQGNPKFYDKTKAIEMLAKHLKIYSDEHKHLHINSLADLVEGSMKDVTPKEVMGRQEDESDRVQNQADAINRPNKDSDS